MANLDFVKEWDERQQAASTSTLLGAQGSPDEAQRAIELQALTGTPAAVIKDDLEQTEINTRGAMGADIVNSNQTLRRYVNENPLGSTLSNDDWATLDSLTSQVSKSERPWAITRGFVSGLFKQNPELYGEAAEAVSHLVPKGSFAQQGLESVPGLIKSITPELKDYALTGKRLRDVSSTGEAFETLGEMFGSGLSSVVPVIAGAMVGGAVGAAPGAAIGGLGASAPLSLGEVYKALKDEGVDKDRAAGYAVMVLPIMAGLDYAGIAVGPLGQLLGLSAVKEVAIDQVKKYAIRNVAKGIAKGMAVEGLTEGAQELAKNATVSVASSKPFFSIDTVFDALEAAVGGFMVGGAMHGPAAFAHQRQQMHELEAKLRPFVQAGEEPPIGLDPQIDKVKLEQSKEDLEELDEQFKEAQKSTTRERSPDTFADLLKMETNAKVYIPFEQVVALYGDNVPHPEDGILGWVPGIMEQLRTMAMVNGDIVIPKADWLARVEPEVAKELHDHLRVRQTGFSREGAKEYNEAKQALADIDVFHGSPHEFDAFSMEAIGTGEGAQSYGHGLYFAENKSVAESYTMAGGRSARKWSVDGTVIDALGINSLDNAANPKAAAVYLMDSANGKVERALEHARHEQRRNPDDAEFLQNVINVLLKGNIVPVERPNLYRVRIKANPEEFLDWDKTFDQQSPRVQEILNKIASDSPEIASRIFTKPEFESLGPKTGRDIYGGIGRGIARGLGQDMDRRDRQASERLRSMGIPGIRYLDQGSRDVTNAKKNIEYQQTAIDELQKQVEEQKAKGLPTATIEKEIAEWKEFQRIEQEKIDKATYNYVLFDDSLVEILDRNGEAVQAVRAQAALDAGPNYIRGRGDLIQVSPGTELRVPRKEDLTNVDKLIFHAVDKVLSRIAPNLLHAGGYDISMDGQGVRGMYESYKDRAPLVLWSYDSPNVLGTARHEAVHYLRRMGYLTETEWESLRTAAIKEDWLTPHRIKERYPDADPETQIEEAIAEQYSKVWAVTPGNVPSAIGKVFEKISVVLAAVKQAINEALGFTPTPEQIFQAIESGEIGNRTGAVPLDKEVHAGEKLAQKPEQLELDVTRQEDKPVFKTGAAMNISQPTLKKLLALITKRDQEDIEAQRARAIAFQKKVQTAAWKEESDALEDEVRADLNNRPDIAAANFFRYGELHGVKLDKRPKLNAALLTPEQRASLPEHWVGEGGVNPDDAAGLFGYQTGAELVDRLATVEQVRGNIRPGEFLYRLVKAETQRRMVAKHGNLDENILNEAEEHVLGITQMDLLHEQTIALGEQAKQTITFTKESVKEMAENGFLNYPADNVAVQGFLNDSGKAGRRVIEAAAKEDWLTAFKEQQAQYFAGLMGREAIKFEKEMTRLDRLMKRLNKRKVTGIDNNYLNAAQWLMQQAGIPTRRSKDEITGMMQQEGWNNFGEFVVSQVNDGYEVAIPDSILNGVKQWDKMTVLDRKEFYAALKSLNSIGRKVNKITVDGVAHDYDQYINSIVSNIKSLPKRDPKGQGNFFYRFDAWMARPEEIIKDLDLRQEAGPLWQIYRTLAEGKHQEYSWQEKLVKKMKGISGEYGKDWLNGLQKAIPNDFFIDPETDQPFNMTRGMMLNIMMNWGNRSNIEKFTRGWFGKEHAAQAEAKLFDWFETHATKQDWEFVQHIWDIFEDWAEPANQMYQRLSGVGPKMLVAEQVNTQHGPFRGGYFPIIKDPLRNTGEYASSNALFGPVTTRSTPANAYTITRTGAPVKIEFEYSVDAIAARMQQVIHDISFREPLMEAWKVFKDKRVQAAIKSHYGMEYNDQMLPWLKRVASNTNLDEQANGLPLSFMRRTRSHIVGHSLPFNLRVVLSPDVGLFNPADVARILADREKYVEMAWQNSKEIPHTFQNMDRDYREHFEGLITKHGLKGTQATAVRAGFIPIAKFSQGFRIITFVTEFEKHLADGKDQGTAAALADSTVRERHGSGSPVDMSAMMGSPDEAIKMVTMFMGFFNMSYNWMRQIPGNVKRKEFGKAMEAFYGSVLIGAVFGAALFNKWDKNDNWFTFSGKALLLQVAGLIPFGREIASYAVEGFAPSTPWGSIIKAIHTGGRDVKKLYEGKKVDKPIQHAANVIGLGTGLPMAQIGRTGQFVADVYTGKQRPENFGQYISGIIHGEAVRK